MTGRWDDNVLATSTSEVDDFVTLINPALQMQSDWNNHALNFSADAEIARFSERDRENYEDYNVAFDSRLDVRRSTNITAGAGFGAGHEPRTSPDDVAGIEPTEFNHTSAQAAAHYRINRLSLTLSGSGNRIDFDDSISAAGAAINNDDRDRSAYEGSLRFGFEISPTSEAQLVGSIRQVKYDDSVDDRGVNRDSDGFSVEAGVVLDITGVVFVNVLVGAFEQSYDDPTFSDIDGASFRLGLNWDVTALTTVTGAVTRSVEETTQATASGVLRTSVELGVDHELFRNLIISAGVASFTQDFEGVPREDQTLDLSFGAQYLLHPRIVLEFGANVTSRDSDIATQDFDRNRYFFRFVGRL